jgi:hypothetical protein
MQFLGESGVACAWSLGGGEASSSLLSVTKEAERSEKNSYFNLNKIVFYENVLAHGNERHE